REQPVRNLETERSRGLEIDDKLEFGRLFDRQIAGVGAFENFVDVACGAAKNIAVVWSITDQAASFGKSTIGIHRGQPISRSQIKILFSLNKEDGMGNNDERLYILFFYFFDRFLNQTHSENRQRMKL